MLKALYFANQTVSKVVQMPIYVNQEVAFNKEKAQVGHSYPLNFLLYLTMVCYKVNYLPVGIRIWFWPNCLIRVFGDMANFSSEIGEKWPKMASKMLNFFGGGPHR